MKDNYKAWQISTKNYPKGGSIQDKILYFCKFGILAANIHNTQPWKFKIIDNTLFISGDKSKQLLFADPTGKNLWISLGCCVKNIEVIASFHGYKTTINYDNLGNIVLSFTKGSYKTLSQLAPFITKRFSNRMPYSDKPIEQEKLKKLESVKVEGASYFYNSNLTVISKTAELYGKAVIMLTKLSPGIAKELVKWLKTSSSDSAEGMPMFIQGFTNGQSRIMKKLMALAPPGFGAKMVAKQDMKKIKGSPLVAVITNPGKDKKDWVDTGRAYQELALNCFKEGIFVTPMHSIVEYKNTRIELSKIFGLSGENVPQMFFRLGYASNTHYHTPRKPLEWSLDTESELARTIDAKIEIDKIKIGKYDINYIKAGRGKPLVLIHGGNIGWGQWYPNIKELAKYFTIYAIDLPGGGRSSRVNFKDIDFHKDFVDIVDEFIKKLSLKNPNLLGSSVGGWVVVQLVLKNKNIGKIVVADSVGFTDYVSPADLVMGNSTVTSLLTKTIFKPLRSNKNTEKLLRSVFFNSNLKLNQQFVNYFYETTESSHNLLLISRMSSAIKELYLKQELPKVKNKTLIIWGERDKFMPVEKCKDNFNLISNRQVKILKNGGHIVSIEKADEFNKSVISFLK